MLNVFKENQFRYGMSMLSALLIALIINHYYAITPGFLMPLTAVYVMQTPIGNPFYHGLKRFIVLALFVALIAFLLLSLRFFYWVMHDIFIGALIGFVANSLILPRRADTAFREALLPLAKSYNDYFMQTIDLLLQKNTVNTGNAALERNIQTLPSWVYELGFDNGLQKGYRFFLIKFEQLSDVLFAMHHLARFDYDKELIAKLRLPLLECAEFVSQFFFAVITVLELKKLKQEPSDLEKEIEALDKQFHTVVPLSLELLDMKLDYVNLAQFIYYFRDLRKLLLKLAEALR